MRKPMIKIQFIRKYRKPKYKKFSLLGYNRSNRVADQIITEIVNEKN